MGNSIPASDNFVLKLLQRGYEVEGIRNSCKTGPFIASGRQQRSHTLGRLIDL